MHKIFSKRVPSLRPVLPFLLWWLLGIFAGTVSAGFVGPVFSSRMLLSLSGQSSIVVFALRVFLPFLLCILAAHLKSRKLLYFVCCCKIFSFCFCGRLIYRIYGAAGWLLRGFLLFSDIISVPVICLFCLASIRSQLRLNKRLIALCAAVILLALLADYFVVTPFWAEQIDIEMGRYAYPCWT